MFGLVEVGTRERQTAVLFIVVGIEGLRLLTTQFVVWEPHFDIICKHGELGDLLGVDNLLCRN